MIEKQINFDFKKQARQEGEYTISFQDAYKIAVLIFGNSETILIQSFMNNL